jgi:SAM-dependent MidA family methyltransferase
LEPVLPEGYIVEVPSPAVDWWKRAASRLSQGRLLAIDYGLDLSEMMAPERTSGTLRAYRNHKLQPDPLQDPGQQDLTCHVPFPWIEEAGLVSGLSTEMLVTQEKFLTRIAAAIPVQRWTHEKIRQFQTLTHPDHFGRSFKVFVQRKGG